MLGACQWQGELILETSAKPKTANTPCEAGTTTALSLDFSNNKSVPTAGLAGQVIAVHVRKRMTSQGIGTPLDAHAAGSHSEAR